MVGLSQIITSRDYYRLDHSQETKSFSLQRSLNTVPTVTEISSPEINKVVASRQRFVVTSFTTNGNIRLVSETVSPLVITQEIKYGLNLLALSPEPEDSTVEIIAGEDLKMLGALCNVRMLFLPIWRGNNLEELCMLNPENLYIKNAIGVSYMDVIIKALGPLATNVSIRPILLLKTKEKSLSKFDF